MVWEAYLAFSGLELEKSVEGKVGFKKQESGQSQASLAILVQVLQRFDCDLASLEGPLEFLSQFCCHIWSGSCPRFFFF